ncbi:Restnol dehydrogenase [Operophtera brumata]|uniref:Restnol dehydrogenase n=1 Tax=Operophtera brumata TaxID=104452 RepID=A0A0L7L3U3_OPEBR|nr:Restnol dehydrogenase [Operophtera brumata]
MDYLSGARVIMACRNMDIAAFAKREIEESTAEKSTGTLIIENIDLCSLKSVREFAERVLASEDRVNILVNNAGVMCCPESRTEGGLETHIGSNHFAHALLTLLLLPKITKIHKIDLNDINFDKTPYNSLEAYSKSKIANIMFARALALQLKNNNIKDVTTYSLCPGIVYTNIDRHFKDTAWFWLTYFFRSPLLRWMWKSPRCGAQTTVYCAVDEECSTESGLYYRSEKRLEGCTAIVTGCNTGIGKETALDFYARAKEEIEQKAKSEKAGTLIVEKLDLCSLNSVREFVRRVLEKESCLQILVNNAGVMMCPEGRTEDGFETHIGSNHFGHSLLTLLLLPTMVRSSPSRIVNVSSYLHARFNLPLDDLNFDKTPYDAFAAYCRSKAANEHNIEGVTTYSLHPGVIRTDISRHFDKTVWYGASWAFNNILGWFMKSTKCGAQTTIFCAVDDACVDESGLYYSDCAVKQPSKQCQHEDQVDRLWTLTADSLKYDPFAKDIPSKHL